MTEKNSMESENTQLKSMLEQEK